MLKHIKEYNALSPDLRKKLNDERTKVGKTAKYKFYIAQRNPDGQHLAGGEYLYPALYTLTPVTFEIIDPGDKEAKPIGLADRIDRNEGREEVKCRRVQLTERVSGILTLDMQKPEDREVFDYLELHPKMEGGMFRDKNIPAMFARVDELKEAKNRLVRRELRSTALSVATRMSEKEVRDFSAAMNWNELDDLEVLRDKMTEIADKDPEFFRKFVDDPTIEYKSLIRRAVDAGIVSWIPVENKFVWTSNGSTIAMLERTESDKYLDKMAEWFITHKNGQETFKKIKSLLSGKSAEQPIDLRK